jgi:glycerol dehydrogenase-like iron-containing ADH family enzyme
MLLPVMNQAGAAEILCSHTSLFDWRIAHEAGVDVQWDEELYRSTQDELDRLDDYAPAIGAGECNAFVEIIEVGAKFARGFTTHPKARFNSGSEHILAWALEQQSGRRLIHGEAVNLGILLMAHIQGNNPGRAADVIRAAKMRFQTRTARHHLADCGRDRDATAGVLPATCPGTQSSPNSTGAKAGGANLASRFAAARDYVERLGLVN